MLYYDENYNQLYSRAAASQLAPSSSQLTKAHFPIFMLISSSPSLAGSVSAPKEGKRKTRRRKKKILCPEVITAEQPQHHQLVCY